MLFPYKYVEHDMEKMQAFVDFIFFDVWCEASDREYGMHLFEPFEPLYQIMDALHRRDLADSLSKGAGKWFYEKVNQIFNEFQALSDVEIADYRKLYQENNLIEELCLNQQGATPTQYSDLNASNADLNGKISEFFKQLYSSGFFGLSFVRKILGADLGSYYVDFVKNNDVGCCPFCGLLPIDNAFDPTREAFDHYLPKSKYPFNSVNLKNLAPSCNKCNSGNKQDKDPLHDGRGNRRKAFYPFSTVGSDIHISVEIHSEDWVAPAPSDITVSVSSDTHSDEVETWDDLFRIKERYSARCCDNGGGLYWQRRVLDESENYGLSTEEMFDAEIKSAESNPWSESNFLKKAFLEGCQRAGFFESLQGAG